MTATNRLHSSREAGSHADLAALQEERDLALAALARLDAERESGELDEADHHSLREEATARAAAALRALEAARPPVPSPGAVPIPADRGPAGSGPAPAAGAPGSGGLAAIAASGGRSKRQRWSLAGAILSFVVVAGVLVGHFAAIRQARPLSVGSPVTDQATGTQALARTLIEGRVLAGQGNDVAALRLFRQVLRAHPDQPEALAYDGWLLRLAGVADHSRPLVTQGRALVAQAAATDPSYPDAHVFLGYMLLQDTHDPIDAVYQFKEFLVDHPDPALVARTAPVVAQAFKDVGQPPPPSTVSRP